MQHPRPRTKKNGRIELSCCAATVVQSRRHGDLALLGGQSFESHNRRRIPVNRGILRTPRNCLGLLGLGGGVRILSLFARLPPSLNDVAGAVLGPASRVQCPRGTKCSFETKRSFSSFEPHTRSCRAETSDGTHALGTGERESGLTNVPWGFAWRAAAGLLGRSIVLESSAALVDKLDIGRRNSGLSPSSGILSPPSPCCWRPARFSRWGGEIMQDQDRGASKK